MKSNHEREKWVRGLVGWCSWDRETKIHPCSSAPEMNETQEGTDHLQFCSGLIDNDGKMRQTLKGLLLGELKREDEETEL